MKETQIVSTFVIYSNKAREKYIPFSFYCVLLGFFFYCCSGVHPSSYEVTDLIQYVTLRDSGESIVSSGSWQLLSMKIKT